MVSELFAVGPAALKIRRPIDTVVERTREVEVFGDPRLDRGTIFPDVGVIAGTSKGGSVGHGVGPSVACCGMWRAAAPSPLFAE
jgi:hypothetical protein